MNKKLVLFVSSLECANCKGMLIKAIKNLPSTGQGSAWFGLSCWTVLVIRNN